MIVVGAGQWVAFGWIAQRDPPNDVLVRMREIDPGADLRWVPGPASRPPRWEIGCWWEPNRAHRELATIWLDEQMRRPESKRNRARIEFCRYVLRGWRPIEMIDWEPDALDVERFRMLDFLMRNLFEREEREFFERLDRQDELHEEDFSRKVRNALHDYALYGMLTKARKSHLTIGFKNGFGQG